jgi:hypothetical protein
MVIHFAYYSEDNDMKWCCSWGSVLCVYAYCIAFSYCVYDYVAGTRTDEPFCFGFVTRVTGSLCIFQGQSPMGG